MPKTETPAFQPLGRGPSFVIDGNELVLRVPLDRSAARPSSSGKMVLVAETGGWLTVPGTDNLRINVMAGYKAG